MIGFTLNREDAIDQKRLDLIRIDNQIREYEIEYMKTLIDCFNLEYTWDQMFNLEDVSNRLKNNQTLFILKLNSTPIGYVWFREFDNQTTFLYNLYVTKKIKRSKLTSIWFINEVCLQMLKIYSTIKCECEDWNLAAQKVFESNNFIREHNKIGE